MRPISEASRSSFFASCRQAGLAGSGSGRPVLRPGPSATGALQVPVVLLSGCPGQRTFWQTQGRAWLRAMSDLQQAIGGECFDIELPDPQGEGDFGK